MTYRRLNGKSLYDATFDAGFRPDTIQDGNGQTTRTTYTAQGLPAEQTNALGQVTRAAYDARSNLTVLTDTLGIAVRYTYDSLNNVVSVTTGITTTSNLRLTTQTRYQYRSATGAWSSTETGATDSRVYETVAADGVVTRYLYDATVPHRVIEIVLAPGTPLQQRMTYGYDALGRRQTITTGTGTALARTDRTEYNADNTIARTIQNYKDGVFDSAKLDEDIITTYGYDALGRQIWTRKVLGRYDVTQYDAKGRVSWTTQNLGGYTGGTLPATPPPMC